MKSRKAQGVFLIRPWGGEWERWPLFGGGGPESDAERGSADELARRGGSILAVPARGVVAAPLWIDSTEAQVVDESARLELDVRGLLPRKPSSGGVVLRTIGVDGRSLAVAAVFPADVPAPFREATFERYEASPFLLPLEPDTVTFWREGADLVAAFTRGPDVVYWETLDFTDDPAAVSNWLTLISLELSAAGILQFPMRLVNWLDGFSADRLVLPAGIRPPDGPAVPEATPVLDRARFEWKPAPVLEAEAATRARGRLRRVGMLAGAGYLFLVLAALGVMGGLRWQIVLRQQRLASLEREAGEFAPVVREWRAIAPTVNPEVFPLEILHQVVALMPADGIRLTLFDVTDNKVQVRGEASSAVAATAFYSSIEDSPDLVTIIWQMPPVVFLPDSRVQFEISGEVIEL